MNQEWKKNWGGHLELWSHDDKKDKPKKMEKKVINKFNRAIIFDTTQNSWHGLPYKTEQPKNINRQSMALYYLSEPRQNISKRTRAYFIPRKEQENNKKVLSIIKKRAGL